MNETPDPGSWSGTPQEQMPALPRHGGGALWQPQPIGHPLQEDSGYGQAEGSNFAHDLRRYFWILVRHRWVLLGVVAVFVCLGFLFTFLSTPIYSASATIQIDREPAKVLNMEEVQADLGSEVAFYATQYEILKSRSLAEKIVAKFSVNELQQFTQDDVQSPWSRLTQAFRKILHPGSEVDEQGNTDVAALQRDAAYRLLDGLSVQPVGTSRVVRLSFEFPNAAWAQRIANAVAESFLALTLDRRFEASSYARNFLEERLKELKVKLEDSERSLVAYAQQQKIVSVDDKQSLVAANLQSINTDLAETSSKRLNAEQLLRQAETTDGLSLPQIMNDTSVRAMRDKRVDLAEDYQNQLSFFKPGYPDMLKIKAQINELDRQIKQSVDNAKQALKADYEALASQEEMLKQRLEETKAEVLDLDNRGIQYRILQREVDTNRQLYDGLLQRFKEVGVAGAVGTNNVSIVDAAELPASPFKPRLSKNLSLALAFGLFFGGLAAFGIEYLDDTFKVPEDVEANLSLPVLGIIPITESAEDFREQFANSRSPVSEAYRSLRTALQFSTADGAPKTLLVTSARPSEGKSTTAVALATNFAQLGLRVLLIDADLRNPSLHKSFPGAAPCGLSNYLTSRSNALPKGAFQETEHPGLTLMPSGPMPPNPAELLAGPKMPLLLQVTAGRFDIVVVDGPPVMGIADAPLLASIASGTLLVIEAGRTRRGVTMTALKRLHYARAQMIGALLNKFDARAVGHTYGYGYGYGASDYYGYGAEQQKQLEQDQV